MRKIYIYRSGNENDVQRFFQKADEKTQNKFKSILTNISNEKNPLCEPYVKHISIGKYRELYEIRMKVSGNMVRVLFVKQGEDIVLLYAFYKRNGKDTEKALEAAFRMLNRMRDSCEVMEIRVA